MSAETLLKLGGTQNRAWVECRVMRLVCNIEASGKSFGMKLMKRMGWKEGEGLGKDGDGQQTHIHIKRRPENQGNVLSLLDQFQVWVCLITRQTRLSFRQLETSMTFCRI